MNWTRTHLIAAVGITMIGVYSSNAAIVEVANGKIGGSGAPATVSSSISVGAGADMLIVMHASELGGGGPTVMRYGGIEMDIAVGSTTTSQAAIYYLDLSTPGITGTTLEADMSAWSVRNGFAAGWVSVDGNLGAGEYIDVHDTEMVAVGAPALDNSIDLVTTVETFNVVTFNGNESGTVTVNAPLTVVYEDDNIGSARSAAGYEEQVAAGTSTYSWVLNNPNSGSGTVNADYRRIAAAAFEVVPEPGSLALLGIGGLLIVRRRR